MRIIIFVFFTILLTNSINGEICQDLAPDCIWWAPYCDTDMENPYVQENCRLTCGFCHVTGTTAKPCYDTGSNCLDAGICENTIVAMTTCRFTCNECNAMYTGPTLPAEPDYPDYTLPTSSSTCFDTISGCEGMKELCNDPAYQPLMLKECRLSCGFC